MKFEDAELPDSPMMRRAFLVTEMDVQSGKNHHDG